MLRQPRFERRRRGRAMKGRRAIAGRLLTIDELCRGPGNVTMAMGIALAENRLDLLGDRLFIEDRGLEVGQIEWSQRIGIRVGTDRLWRAYVEGCAAVSSPQKRSTQRTPRTQRTQRARRNE